MSHSTQNRSFRTKVSIDLYTALSWLISKVKRSGMAHVNDSFTCHPHVYLQVEWTMPAFTPQLQSITALWLVLISHPAEGRRLSWPGWLGKILRWFVRRRWSPIPVLTGPDVEQLRWYVQQRYRYATTETFPKPVSGLGMEKQNLSLTQQKHACTNQKKRTATQNKQKKTKARFSLLLRHLAWKRKGSILVSALDKFVTYLDTSLTAPDPNGARRQLNVTIKAAVVRESQKFFTMHSLITNYWSPNTLHPQTV